MTLCGSKSRTTLCQLTAGHRGLHQNGTFMWTGIKVKGATLATPRFEPFSRAETRVEDLIEALREEKVLTPEK